MLFRVPPLLLLVYTFSPSPFVYSVELDSRFTSLLTHLSYPFRFQFSYFSHFVSLYSLIDLCSCPLSESLKLDSVPFKRNSVI